MRGADGVWSALEFRRNLCLEKNFAVGPDQGSEGLGSPGAERLRGSLPENVPKGETGRREEKVERVTRFERATSSLARKCSTN